MSKHTKEHWICDKYNNVNDSQGRTIKVQGFALSSGEEVKENTRRIVACVNACRGLDTKDLEKNGLVSAVGSELIRLEAINAELVEALSDVMHLLEYGASVHGLVRPTKEKALSALAKAKEQK